MTSGTPAETQTRKNPTEFDPEVYTNLPPGELVTFAIQLLQSEETPATVEEIVSTCFRLFPHSFALKNYFYWPDSALVMRRINDAREKGYVKGVPADGLALKVKGKRAAKLVAKALGFVLPTPPKVEKVKAEQPKEESASLPTETVESKKPEPEPTPTVKKKPAKKSKPAVKKVKSKAKKETAKKQPKAKPSATPAKPKEKPKAKPKPKKQVKPAAEKKTSAKKTSTPKPKVEKKATVKKSAAPKKQVKPAAKKAPDQKKETPQAKRKPQAAKKKEAKTSQPAQLTMELSAPPVTSSPKIPAKVAATKPKVKKEAKPVKQQVAPVPQMQVSKEEKVKAGKVVKMMEHSDAYQQYKKNGGKARISEFDFRNMLFTTMESSAETLKRNVDLFKRYAGIHNRADLITFLSFCEDSFAPLLRTQAKPARK